MAYDIYEFKNTTVRFDRKSEETSELYWDVRHDITSAKRNDDGDMVYTLNIEYYA